MLWCEYWISRGEYICPRAMIDWLILDWWDVPRGRAGADEPRLLGILLGILEYITGWLLPLIVWFDWLLPLIELLAAIDWFNWLLPLALVLFKGTKPEELVYCWLSIGCEYSSSESESVIWIISSSWFHEYTNMRIREYANMRIREYANTRICEYANIRMNK